MQSVEGQLFRRDRQGTRRRRQCFADPLANLFLHYAFDLWVLKRHLPGVRFARFTPTDAWLHCSSRRQAAYVLIA